MKTGYLCIYMLFQAFSFNFVTTAKKKYNGKLVLLHRANMDSQEVQKYIGDTFTMDCMLEGDPVPYPNITWEKDDKPIQNVNFRLSNFAGDLKKMRVLSLQDLLISDTGKYKCTADNNVAKPASTSFTLIVSDKILYEEPIMESLLPINPVLKVKESVTFSCTSKRNKDVLPYILWKRYRRYKVATTTLKTNATNITTTLTATTPPILLESSRLTNSTSVMDGYVHEYTSLKLDRHTTSILTIASVTPEDAGEYFCVVSNHLGYVSASTNLTVLVPKLSREELVEKFIVKYAGVSRVSYPLALVVAMPICIVILIVIGCVWVREKQLRRSEKESKQQLLPPGTPPQEKKVPIKTQNSNIDYVINLMPSIHGSDYFSSHTTLHSAKISHQELENKINKDNNAILAPGDHQNEAASPKIDAEFFRNDDSPGQNHPDEDDWEKIEVAALVNA